VCKRTSNFDLLIIVAGDGALSCGEKGVDLVDDDEGDDDDGECWAIAFDYGNILIGSWIGIESIRCMKLGLNEPEHSNLCS
jgi:hypothetical protein